MSGKKSSLLDKEGCTNQGIEAFREGLTDDSCPYPCGGEHGVSQKRIWFMDGYWAAHVVSNVSCVTLEYMLANRRMAK